MPERPESPLPTPAARPTRRWPRRVRRVALVLILILVSAFAIVTQTPVAGLIVLPRISSALGVDAQADWVRLSLNGDLVIHRLRLRAPGVPGTAGEFASAERLWLDVDLWSALTGRLVLRDIVADKPLIRVSVSTPDGSLNVESLKLPSQSPSGAALPSVAIKDGAIELGENDGAAYTPLKLLRIEGIFGPAPDLGPGQYLARFRDPADTQGQGITITGQVSDLAAAIVMEHFSLDDWPASATPTRVRDMFTALDLQGSVSRTTFLYERGKGITTRLDLERVGVNLPVEAQETAEGPYPPLRMRDVNGSITINRSGLHADLRGLIEDLKYGVRVDWQGTSFDSPFRVEFQSDGFVVGKNPRLLPYATPVIRERLQNFSSPTATVTTHVLVERGPPTASGPSPFNVSGEMRMAHGEAAFEKFPYKFHDLDGLFKFTEDRIDIVKVTGVSASGAKLDAHGWIAPLDETAAAEIIVEARGAPIDQALEDAFGPGRNQIIPALFSTEKHKQLLDAGLVIDAATAAVLRPKLEDARARASRAATLDEKARADAEVANLERRLAAPEFEFRGKVDVKVTVTRERGIDARWPTFVEIHMAKVGLVPDEFPLPIIAQDVVVHAIDRDVNFIGGTYRTLRGGDARVEAHATLPPWSGPAQPILPVVSIQAADVPLDDLLINALPRGRGGGGDTVKRVLRDLRLSGSSHGSVRILPREDGELGFDVDMHLAGATAAPEPISGGAPIRVENITGDIKATERRLSIEGRGDAVARGDSGPRSAGTVELIATADLPGESEDHGADYTITVNGRGIDVEAPVEDIVAIFSREGWSKLAEMRARHRPSGVVDSVTKVVGVAGEVAEIASTIAPVRDVSFDALGGRVGVGACTGSMVVSPVGLGCVRFDTLRAPVTFDGAAAGAATLHGEVPIGARAGDPSHFAARLDGVAFESPLVRRAAAVWIGEKAETFIEQTRPHGQFDATVTMEWAQAAPDGPAPAPAVRVRVEPRSLAGTLRGTEVAFTDIVGAVEFDGTSGVFRGITAQSDGWWLAGDGSWVIGEDSAVTTSVLVSAGGDSLKPEARAILPAELDETLKNLELDIEGEFRLEDGQLAFTLGGDPERRKTSFIGSLRFKDASMAAGVSLTECEGRADTEYLAAGSAAPSLGVTVLADRLRVAGVEMTRARARLVSGRTAGEVLLTTAEAECHGGRVAARAWVGPAQPERAGSRGYSGEVESAGVRLAPLIDDLAAAMGPAKPAPVSDPPPATDVPGGGAVEPDRADRAPPDESRGIVDSEFSMSGRTNDTESRRGRGSVRVFGGRVLNLPFVMPLVEVSNLQLPGNARLDYAQARMFLDGGTVVFEDLSVFSQAVVILGYGTMSWPGLELNLRFNSKAARPIPLLSAIIEGIRNEIVTTEVSGKLGSQQVRLRDFPGARRMLGRAVGAPETEQARRLEEIELRGEGNLRRLESRGETIEGARPPADPDPDSPSPKPPR